MTRIFNFALKIKGGGREGGTCEVLLPCHPPPPHKKNWNVHQLDFFLWTLLSSAQYIFSFYLKEICRFLIG